MCVRRNKVQSGTSLSELVSLFFPPSSGVYIWPVLPTTPKVTCPELLRTHITKKLSETWKSNYQELWSVGLNDSGPIGSATWILGAQLVELVGKIRRCNLVGGGVSLGMGFEVSEDHSIPSVFSVFSSYLRCELLDIPVTTPSLHRHGLWLLGTVSLIKCFLLYFALVIAFYHSNRKVTSTHGFIEIHKKMMFVAPKLTFLMKTLCNFHSVLLYCLRVLFWPVTDTAGGKKLSQSLKWSDDDEWRLCCI